MNETMDTPEVERSLMQKLGDAIKGTEADYTKIPLKTAILLLAVPMILELIMESTFALVDILFVGKLGASAVATVGLTENYLFLLYSIAMGVATAVTAVVAKKVGEKDTEGASISAAQAIYIAVLVSLPFSLAGILFPKELLSLMGATDWSLEHGYRYTQWMLGSNVVIVLLFVVNAIFRGAGDAAIAMRVLVISNLINIVLDPIFIFGWGPIPAMGVEGAAIATTIGRSCAVVIQLWAIFNIGKHIRIYRRHLRLNWSSVFHIIKASVGGVGQMLVAMTAWIFLMRILAETGEHAVAGATITIRVMMFTLMPAWGFSNAAATLVGQNLGAGQPDRAEASVWRIGVWNMVFLIGVSIVFYFFHDQIIGCFTADQNVIDVGGEWLQIVAYSYFVYGWWMVAVQAFNGSGDTLTPTWINLGFFWFLQIPLAWFLAIHLEWSYSGVFWAVFISETSVGLFTLWLFSRGKWKIAKS